jgi:hypothetical protein
MPPTSNPYLPPTDPNPSSPRARARRRRWTLSWRPGCGPRARRRWGWTPTRTSRDRAAAAAARQTRPPTRPPPAHQTRDPRGGRLRLPPAPPVEQACTRTRQSPGRPLQPLGGKPPPVVTRSSRLKAILHVAVHIYGGVERSRRAATRVLGLKGRARARRATGNGAGAGGSVGRGARCRAAGRAGAGVPGGRVVGGPRWARQAVAPGGGRWEGRGLCSRAAKSANRGGENTAVRAGAECMEFRGGCLLGGPRGGGLLCARGPLQRFAGGPLRVRGKGLLGRQRRACIARKGGVGWRGEGVAGPGCRAGGGAVQKGRRRPPLWQGRCCGGI